jgi:hypothetical protein
MDDRGQLVELSERLATAISRRDVGAIRGLLAKEFVQRPTGGDAVETNAFLSGITQIPGDILFVRSSSSRSTCRATPRS